MAGIDPAGGTSPSAGDLPQDPASAEANAATIDHLRHLLADHAAGRIHSDLWDENRAGPASESGHAGAHQAEAFSGAATGAGPAQPGAGTTGPRGAATGADGAGGGPAGPPVGHPGDPGPSPGDEPAGDVDMPGHRAPAGAAGTPAGGDGPQEETDPHERGRQIALRQLSFSARSRHQLAQAMLERDVPEPVVTEILDRFEQVGLVDDAEYAAMLVRTRYQERGLARPALAEELRRKGITGPLAEAALDQIDTDDERLAARELVERRLRAMGPVEPSKRRQRLYSMLARRGYGTSVAVSVVDEALAAEGLSRY